MDESLVLQEDHEGGIRILTLNRPKALNALNGPLMCQLHAALLAADQDTEIRVLILQGAGEKAFVAGADITELEMMSPLDAVAYSRRGHEVMELIEHLSKPVIASVNGFALGGGLELALACDFIYASESSSFGLVEANLGLIPGYGGVGRLTRKIGEAAAREALLTAKRYTADEAFRLGLVNQVLAAEELTPAVMKVAGNIAAKSPASIQVLRSLFDSSRGCDHQTTIELEQRAFGLMFSDPDAKEGIRAFMEKRKPEFKGNRQS